MFEYLVDVLLKLCFKFIEINLVDVNNIYKLLLL